MTEPQPIATAPLNQRVLLWWTPITPNRWAECWITGEVSSYEPGKYWDGRGDEAECYKPLERITHWKPLPPPPAERVATQKTGDLDG